MADEDEIEAALANVPYLQLAQAAKRELNLRQFKENYSWSVGYNMCAPEPFYTFYEITGVPKRVFEAYYKIKMQAPEDIVKRITESTKSLDFIREHTREGRCCAPSEHVRENSMSFDKFHPTRLAEKDNWSDNIIQFMI